MRTMREILFRGKAINRVEGGEYRSNYKNGDWVYGLITRLFNERFKELPAEMTNTNGVKGIEVDYKTVGQFTGLYDKNGKKIFEGDIVKCREIYNDIEFTAVVEFGNPNRAYNWGWQLRIIDGDEYINPDILLWVDMEDTGAICEVIGTVHDNPELIETEG